MGIVAMKVLGAWVFNHNAAQMVEGYDPAALKALPGAAMRWVLSDDRVHLLNIGMSVPADGDDCLSILSADTKLTEADKALLADFSAKAYLHPSIQDMPVVQSGRVGYRRRTSRALDPLSPEEAPKSPVFDACSEFCNFLVCRVYLLEYKLDFVGSPRDSC